MHSESFLLQPDGQTPSPSHPSQKNTPKPDAEAERLHLLDDPAEWPSFGKPVWPTAQGQPPEEGGQTAPDPELAPAWDSQVVLQGMYCATCALTIEDALRAVPGVERVEVSAAAERARIVWRPDAVRPSQWMAAIARAGYSAVPAQDAQARTLRQAQQRKALWRWLLALFAMMQVMMYAWPAYEALPGDLSLEMETLLRWASWVICIPVLIYSCGPFFTGAWRDLRQGRISMDLPVALGMGLTFVVSSLGTFNPEGIFGKEVFFDSLAMFAAFLLAGRWLEVRLRERTAGALDAVLNRLPESVLRQGADGEFERTSLRRVQVGDVLRVLPGEAFPADGLLLEGRTQADEALLTGESRAIAKAQGDSVIAGSYNLSAPVQMQVQALGAQTKFSQIVGLMESAITQKPRLAQLADRVAGPFLLVVLLLAAATAVYWWPQDPGRGLMYAAVVLIVTCPCALSLATPVAMLTAAGTLAKQGVLVRNLQALESLAQLDSLVFDKTGTLTQEGMRVSAIYSAAQPRQALADATDMPWAGLAQALAKQSHHPVSRALQNLALAPEQAWSGQLLQVQELAGQGLRAQLSHPDLWQGRARWLRLGSLAFAGGQWPVPLEQAVYLGLEEQEALVHEEGVEAIDAPVTALAAFSLHEGLRPEAAGVVQDLLAHGLQVHLLSGDGQAAVQRVAQAVGLQGQGGQLVQAHSSPASKLEAMQALQAKGHKVGMVGDGLNDGPVLAGANASFAFGQAVALARAKSDVVVLGSDLRQIPHTLAFARKTMRIVRQNLWWAAGYNALAVPFAAMGMVPPWLAGLGMALSSLWVVLNAARLTRFTGSSAQELVH